MLCARQDARCCACCAVPEGDGHLIRVAEHDVEHVFQRAFELELFQKPVHNLRDSVIVTSRLGGVLQELRGGGMITDIL